MYSQEVKVREKGRSPGGRVATMAGVELHMFPIPRLAQRHILILCHVLTSDVVGWSLHGQSSVFGVFNTIVDNDFFLLVWHKAEQPGDDARFLVKGATTQFLSRHRDS